MAKFKKKATRQTLLRKDCRTLCEECRGIQSYLRLLAWWPAVLRPGGAVLESACSVANAQSKAKSSTTKVPQKKGRRGSETNCETVMERYTHTHALSLSLPLSLSTSLSLSLDLSLWTSLSLSLSGPHHRRLFGWLVGFAWCRSFFAFLFVCLVQKVNFCFDGHSEAKIDFGFSVKPLPFFALLVFLVSLPSSTTTTNNDNNSPVQLALLVLQVGGGGVGVG